MLATASNSATNSSILPTKYPTAIAIIDFIALLAFGFITAIFIRLNFISKGASPYPKNLTITMFCYSSRT